MLDINPEFQEFIPKLSDEEYGKLEKSILEEGIRDAICVWGNTIIDGHNRYRIAQEHDLSYITKQMDFDDEQSVKLWMVNTQLGRRNLGEISRYKLVEIEAEILREIGRRKMSESVARSNVINPRKNQNDVSGLSLNDKPESDDSSPDKPHDTRKEVAKKLGWSTGKVAQTKVVVNALEEKGDTETIEKIDKGETTISKVYQGIKAERKAEERAERAAQAKSIEITSDLVDLRHGDFMEVLANIPDGSVDMILTDPPYPYDFIECWSKLSEFAARVLKPHGFCVAYSGQFHLLEAMNRLSEHLDYSWIISCRHTGATKLYVERQTRNTWKPILIFQKGLKQHTRSYLDVIDGTGTEKNYHEWQQSEAELTPLIEAFSNPGDTICEPFSGGGTTVVVSIKMKRYVIASEIDSNSFNKSKERIHRTLNE